MSRSIWDMLRKYFGETWRWDHDAPEAVPHVMHRVPGLFVHVRARIAARWRDLMLQVQAEEWTQLYPAFRWIDFKPSDVPYLKALEPSVAVEMLGIASLNRNGHVREQAVRALGAMRAHRAMPYVLLRLGDWVAPVRDAANEALFKALAQDTGADILRYAALILHLQRVERVDLRNEVRRIIEHLRRAEVRPAIDQWLGSSDRRAKLLIYEAFEDSLERDASLIERALADSDAAIRRWMAAWLGRRQSQQYLHHLRRLVHDRDARVATQAVRCLSPAMAQAVRDELTENLISIQRTVRQASRFILREQGMTGIRDHYVSLLARGADIPVGVIAGLGETGRPGDFDSVAAFAESRRLQMRQAAVEAMARLDLARACPRLIEALDDPNGKVRRVAISYLQDYCDEAVTKAILRAIRSASPSGQVAAFRTLAGRATWAAVPALLLGVSSANQEIHVQAWERLAGWLRRNSAYGWITPTPATWKSIQAIWAEEDLANFVPPAEYMGAWRAIERWIKQLAAKTPT